VTTASAELYYDPYDETIDRDPHPVWKRLRDEAPLYYNERHDFYALSRFADVMHASTEWQTYSSARATVLEMMDMRPIEEGEGAGDGLGMMIFMDPPGHDVLRRLVSRAFTPRRIADRDARMRELCEHFLAGYRKGSSFDFLDDFAARIPAMVIGDLLGVPKDDQEQLRVWIDDFMRYDPAGFTESNAQAMNNLTGYMEQMVTERRSEAQDDMVSDLLASEITLDDGSTRSLTHDEVMSFFTLLQIAGTETTARLLGWAGILLARHPDQRAKLVATPELIPNAVEELLRYEAPSPIQARFVTRDVDWYGTTVPRNAKIALLTGSAGRDERQYPGPDRFDVERRFDRHVSFGYGIHYCLGAHLARLEGKVVLEEMLRRFPTWDCDEANVQMVRTSTVRGPSRVPITV
jgi:cytochrome P450